MIRVAQIIGKAAEGGVESMIMNYYENINRNEVQFDFFVESVSKIINKKKIEELGGHVVFIPKISSLILNDTKLVKLFKSGNYDIVHSNKTTQNIIYLKAAKKAGIKIRISHSHSTSSKKEPIKAIIKFFLRNFSKCYATHFFACSEKAGRWLFGKACYNNGRVIIINNAIDVNRFKYKSEERLKIRNKLSISDDAFVVGHIGRFVSQKNHEFILLLFKQILVNNNKAILLLVGEGPLLNKTILIAKQMNIYNNVIFAGPQISPENYYQAMDCFVLPSLYEGLPVVGIEAQINGLNCYFSNNITKEVKVNNNVSFFSIRDEHYWANHITSTDELNRQTSYYKFISSKFDIESESDKLLNYYNSFICEVDSK